jgi:fatty-acyl-CoA synthase
MRRDAEGFYTFVDRVGDTFRWKGENVATSEVAAVIGACPGVAEAIVYGVKVPGAEGRAGMALLKIGEGFDLGELSCRLEALPQYARPVFLRFTREVEVTDTFKPARRVYVDEGFDRERIEDPLYVFDGQRRAYVLLDADRHAAIRDGALLL